MDPDGASILGVLPPRPPSPALHLTMRRQPSALGAALLSIVLASVPAAQVGRPLPDSFELQDFAQTGARSADDLVGRAVLVEFFAHWCQSCRISAPRLNQLSERYAELGLTVLGVTDQPKSSTERFIADAGAQYGYAFDRSGSLLRTLEIETFPTAVLIDPGGTVVWTGHTSELTDLQVKDSLEGAFKDPVWEWPRSTRGAVRELKKRRYGRALAALGDASDPEVEEARQALRSIVRMRMERFEERRDVGDWLGAKRLAEELVREMDGLTDEQGHAEWFLDSLRGNDEAHRVIRLQEKLEKLGTTRAGSDRDLQRLIDKVEKIRRQAGDTHAAVQADELLRELRRR